MFEAVVVDESRTYAPRGDNVKVEVGAAPQILAVTGAIGLRRIDLQQSLVRVNASVEIDSAIGQIVPICRLALLQRNRTAYVLGEASSFDVSTGRLSCTLNAGSIRSSIHAGSNPIGYLEVSLDSATFVREPSPTRIIDSDASSVLPLSRFALGMNGSLASFRLPVGGHSEDAVCIFRALDGAVSFEASTTLSEFQRLLQCNLPSNAEGDFLLSLESESMGTV